MPEARHRQLPAIWRGASDMSVGIIKSPECRILSLWVAGYPIVWLLGAWVPYAFLLWVLCFRVWGGALKTSLVVWLIAFLAVQLLSLGISPLVIDVDAVRYAAMLHNIFVYTLIIVGVLLVLHARGVYEFFRDFSSRMIWVYFIAGGMVWLYGNSIGGDLAYRSPFGVVLFTRRDYMLDGVFTRLAFLGDFVNSAAMLAFLLYAIYLVTNFRRASTYMNVLYWVMMMALVVASGSRIVLMMMVLAFPLNMMGKRLVLFVMFLSVPVVLYIIAQADILEALVDARANSSATRSNIYSRSLGMIILPVWVLSHMSMIFRITLWGLIQHI
jgi:hypothetical protein